MRIATWNVRGLRDDSRLLTEVLLAERPDVLCLQEAPLGWRSAGRLRRWAERCGLEWRCRPPTARPRCW